MDTRSSVPCDRLMGEIDKAIKSWLITRPTGVPGRLPEAAAPRSGSSESERRNPVRLMRVNHAGEVAAQALYRGQALTARRPQGHDRHGKPPPRNWTIWPGANSA